MSAGRRRYQLSREEIGILLSYAKRPEAVTQQWMIRLQAGINRADLAEFIALAGLPRSTIERIMAAHADGDAPADSEWSERSVGYRRAVVGVIVVSVIFTVVLTFATVDDTLRSVVIAAVLSLCGMALYSVIARLSGGSR